MAPLHAADAGSAAIRRERMILRYTPLVRHALGSVLRAAPTVLDREDLYGYGTLGLIDAVDRFDAARGVKFETYALVRIRGYVLDQLRASDWLPRSARERVAAVQESSARLEERLGRRPNRREIAADTGLTWAACDRALLESGRMILSLDRLVADDGETAPGALLHRLVDEGSPNPAQVSERRELRRSLRLALARLPERERSLLILRYGRNWSLRRIAGFLGVSESRAAQLHNQALARMRRLLAVPADDAAAKGRSA